MIKLIGVKTLTGQLSRLGRFQQKVHTAMKRKENIYRSTARATVNRVVYSFKENPLYPRSGNLMAATDVHNIKDTADSNVTYIFLNPEKATRSFSYQYRSPEGPLQPQGLLSYWAMIGQGGFRFYPSYVRRGIFFKRRMAPRDFVAGWRNDLVPIYIRDVANAIRKFR